jgi:hypothetical protein
MAGFIPSRLAVSLNKSRLSVADPVAILRNTIDRSYASAIRQ